MIGRESHLYDCKKCYPLLKYETKMYQKGAFDSIEPPMLGGIPKNEAMLVGVLLYLLTPSPTIIPASLVEDKE